jgi:hypothetical protein
LTLCKKSAIILAYFEGDHPIMLTSADRRALISAISDVSKDAWGFRYRADFQSFSDEELEACYESFQAEIGRQCRQADADRAALRAARQHPRGVVTLSRMGQWEADDGREVDPSDPELWDWYIQPEAPANPAFAVAFQAALGQVDISF